MKNRFSTVLCMAACFSMQTLYAQQTPVSGKVVDEKGNPVAGASIHINGKQTGTSTDPSGMFKLNVPSSGSITISAVGYDPKTITLTGQKIFSVTLYLQHQSTG